MITRPWPGAPLWPPPPSWPSRPAPGYGWVVGEQALATGLRRHWVKSGLAKDRIMFCGYWRAS